MARKIQKEELIEAVSKSLTLTDVLNNLSLPQCGGSGDRVKKLAANYAVDLSGLNPKARAALRRKYPLIEKTCPLCGDKFTTRFGHPRETFCCSHGCANKFYAKPKTDEQKKAIFEGMQIAKPGFYKKREHKPRIYKVKKAVFQKEPRPAASPRPLQTKKCLQCGEEFTTKIQDQLYCCRECRGKSPIYRENLRKVQLSRIAAGTHSGWKSRKGKAPSYPERFFMKVLANNAIQYEREFHCGGFFIDFAIHDKKIALEIDGRQHDYADRKERDLRKDEFLKSQGWTVHRIKWRSINNDEGKAYIRNEIQKFIDLYNSSFV